MSTVEQTGQLSPPTKWFGVLANPLDQIGTLRFSLLSIGVLAQLATILITWPLWQVRSNGVPNLPAFEVPELSFGILMFASTMLVPLFPRPGIWINLVVLVVATVFDQVRAQPQFLANWILMFATVVPYGSRVVRLVLVSLWFWTGLHKFLSPDWFTHRSWALMQQSGIDPESTYLVFAYVVASSELGLGLLAWFKPRWAAAICPMMHIGIVIFLSPLFRDWNYSVIPWNLAMAIIGCWVLLDVAKSTKTAIWEYGLLGILMVAPAGFYVGWVDHGYAHVLYSENIPRGIITKLDCEPHEISGWGELAVPFPNERRLLRQYFDKSADVGQKLHIYEPRKWLEEQYFVMTPTGPKQIDAREFYQSSDGTPIGIGADSNRAVFLFAKAGARLLAREEGAMIYAIEIPPAAFSADLFALISQLPNLEQVQLSQTSVTDDDLQCLLGLQRLEGVGLKQTAVTERGIKMLESMPSLKVIKTDQELSQ